MKTNVESKNNRFPAFQKRFNELRGDLPQTEFAKKIGVSTPTVGFYENGNRVPDALTLKRIADVFEVSVDYLLGRADCKTADNEEIRKSIGLSDKSISRLRLLKERKPIIVEDLDPFDMINSLISHGKFYRLIAELMIYLREKQHFNENYEKFFKASAEELKVIEDKAKEYGVVTCKPEVNIKIQESIFSNLFTDIINDICKQERYIQDFSFMIDEDNDRIVRIYDFDGGEEGGEHKT